jgi:hypothetical protein
MPHGEPPTPGHFPNESQYEENLPISKVVGVALVSALIFALGILWVWKILSDEQRTVRNGGVAAPIALAGQPEIGIVDQQLFELEARARVLREKKQKQLDTYGWISREQGLVHIPVRQAIDELVAGAAQPPPPPGAPEQPPSP